MSEETPIEIAKRVRANKAAWDDTSSLVQGAEPDRDTVALAIAVIEAEKKATQAAQVTARIVSVERVMLGRSPVSIVIDAFDERDAKTIVEALKAIGVEPMCVLPWSGS